jgi:hypothetical protein
MKWILNPENARLRASMRRMKLEQREKIKSKRRELSQIVGEIHTANDETERTKSGIKEPWSYSS